ncbi:class I SAM-dependent methyltransferase [Uliginosibacterium sp. 31-16]|uniref:class I SAM-dependent methyltransferase n=1 Tax=Uliginosibacterium sp. 31-16 TaxID=3068315 RepID=UPI00273FFB06|nr:class I SAM-dependent methyltransferase [Uliginosibacterium sp. 31-16]MDP5238288.1 class I SAM-dependent methyltransferase [Uliginosibacterium sp. 31-16]
MHRPLTKALAAQTAGLILVYALSRNGILPNMALVWLACLQGALAAIVSMLLLAPCWWGAIHLAFMPAIILASLLQQPVAVYVCGFFLLLLTYWTSFRTQVPLFLSNHVTVHRLAAWLSDNKPQKVLDVGSGTGSFALRLARLRPDWSVTGIESAPAPYALSRWLGRQTPNLCLLRADFWEHSLSGYDVVYAFLSPVPMPALWAKALREMRPGSLLISNSFTIENARDVEILRIDDRRATHLFVYRIPEIKRK